MEHQTAQHPQYPVYYPQVAPPPPAVVHDGSGATVGLADVGEYGANGGGYGVYQGGMGQNGNNNSELLCLFLACFIRNATFPSARSPPSTTRGSGMAQQLASMQNADLSTFNYHNEIFT